jgi:hypothetical protein
MGLHHVISTEATDGIFVRRAVERPLYMDMALRLLVPRTNTRCTEVSVRASYGRLYVTPSTNWKLFFLNPIGGLFRKLSVAVNDKLNCFHAGTVMPAIAFAE